MCNPTCIWLPCLLHTNFELPLHYLEYNLALNYPQIILCRIGLGTLLSGARHVSDGMLHAAAEEWAPHHISFPVISTRDFPILWTIISLRNSLNSGSQSTIVEFLKWMSIYDILLTELGILPADWLQSWLTSIYRKELFSHLYPGMRNFYCWMQSWFHLMPESKVDRC
jgi:hypothetical protein